MNWRRSAGSKTMFCLNSSGLETHPRGVLCTPSCKFIDPPMATVIASTPQEKRGMAYQKSAHPWARISCGMPLSPLIAGVHVEAQRYFSIRSVVCFLWLDRHIWRRRYPTNLVCPVSYSPTCDRPFSSQSSFPFWVFLLNRVSLCSPCWSPN